MSIGECNFFEKSCQTGMLFDKWVYGLRKTGMDREAVLVKNLGRGKGMGSGGVCRAKGESNRAFLAAERRGKRDELIQKTKDGRFRRQTGSACRERATHSRHIQYSRCSERAAPHLSCRFRDFWLFQTIWAKAVAPWACQKFTMW